MAKYSVTIKTTAFATVDIEVPDDVTDPEEIAERVLSKGDMPDLCAQCSGRNQKFSLELGEWEYAEHYDGPHKGLAYVTDKNGNPVTG